MKNPKKKVELSPLDRALKEKKNAKDQIKHLEQRLNDIKFELSKVETDRDRYRSHAVTYYKGNLECIETSKHYTAKGMVDSYTKLFAKCEKFVIN